MSNMDVPRLLPLLRTLGSCADGEIVNAVHIVRNLLADAGLDIHAMVARLETPSLDVTEMQEIFAAGYTKRRTDEVEERRRSSVAASLSNSYSNFRIDDDDAGDGVNGFSWFDIAWHCAAHIDRIPQGKDRSLVTSVLRRLDDGHGSPTSPQARWLRDIFIRQFNGKI